MDCQGLAPMDDEVTDFSDDPYPLNVICRQVDLLIYNRISKARVLAIEVDGFHYQLCKFFLVFPLRKTSNDEKTDRLESCLHNHKTSRFLIENGWFSNISTVFERIDFSLTPAV